MAILNDLKKSQSDSIRAPKYAPKKRSNNYTKWWKNKNTT